MVCGHEDGPSAHGTVGRGHGPRQLEPPQDHVAALVHGRPSLAENSTCASRQWARLRSPLAVDAGGGDEPLTRRGAQEFFE
jgi:hypothetical protein